MGRAAWGPRRGLTAPAVDGPRVRQNAEGLPGPPGELGRRLRRAGMGRGTSGSPRGGGEGGLRRRWTKERKDGKGEPEAALDAGSRPGHPRGPCADPCLQRHGRVTPCGRSPAPSGSPPGCGHHSLSVRVTRASGSPQELRPGHRLPPSGSPPGRGPSAFSVRVTRAPGSPRGLRPGHPRAGPGYRSPPRTARGRCALATASRSKYLYRGLVCSCTTQAIRPGGRKSGLLRFGAAVALRPWDPPHAASVGTRCRSLGFAAFVSCLGACMQFETVRKPSAQVVGYRESFASARW